jgi:hypothetical protein
VGSRTCVEPSPSHWLTDKLSQPVGIALELHHKNCITKTWQYMVMFLVTTMSAVSGPEPSISCNTRELKSLTDKCLYIVEEHTT